MPELPEVETTRLGLEPVMKSAIIKHVHLFRRDLRQPVPEGFEDALIGKRILSLRRRAKYILIDLEKGPTILAHLGMSGTFTITNASTYTRRTHDHCIMDLDNGYRVVFHDPRRFGLLLLLERENEATHPLIAHLGPEPLSNHFHAAYLSDALKSRKSAIKPVLMDQQIVVGVGNIYASESLFLAGIDPRMPASKAAKHAEKLVISIRTVLQAALQSGGSTLRDYVRSSGDMGYFQHHFRVYDRAEMPCESCLSPIQLMVQAGRSTYFCKQCQRRS
ncbi:MAG: DNA-formamidopyrimidine glycosylase [Alphaproteobacteria bacterium]|nr:DNA-formamidopyrimidine glycosylase [Alphaproteobacteria bacterium]